MGGGGDPVKYGVIFSPVSYKLEDWLWCATNWWRQKSQYNRDGHLGGDNRGKIHIEIQKHVRMVILSILCWYEQYLCSRSCLIDEGETFLLTGGVYNSIGRPMGKTVSRYNINGWMEDLDDLNTERASMHGCTRFTNNDGEKVRMEFVMTCLVCIYCLCRLISFVEDMKTL